MPIGFDFGGGGGVLPAEPSGDIEDIFTWPEIEAAPLIPIVWTRWQTVLDERVCPECGPLDGYAWEEGDGPAPPLHVNCRCVRVYSFTEWRRRE